MIGSLYAGISGLKANTSAMSVIGDNIANVDTTGFKTSRVSFSNIFSATVSQSQLPIGRGVTMSGVDEQWEGGSLENTNSPTDLSVNGKGLFLVNDPVDNATYYTRAGKFEFDKDGFFVNPDGLLVQGYSIDVNGNYGPMGDIQMPIRTNAPLPTTTINFSLNLDSRAADGDTFNSTITVFDSLGTPIELTLAFTFDQANGQWNWVATPSEGVSASTGSLVFDTSGNLDPAASTPSGAEPVIAITGLSGADLAITWDYLDGVATSGDVTGYASESVKTSQSQNGYSSGLLQGVAVDEDGVFTALYSNGVNSPFAHIALADFPSYTGLAKQGSNLYGESLTSGQPVVSLPGAAGLGTIAPNTLERSNVDLSSEFVEMITTQRAFQANAKVITTSDEILAELINIKR